MNITNRRVEEDGMSYTFYYRNYLKSCNYKCEYCPFAKGVASEQMLARDRSYLDKFMHFIETSNRRCSIFFAPRGEMLTYDYFQKALMSLSKLENVDEIVTQTNLSCNLEWFENLDASKLVLWATYHPSQVEGRRFFEQVKKLHSYNVKFTIGAVGVKENFSKITEMYHLLNELGPNKPYMWINAYKDKKGYYSFEDIQFLKNHDPLFEINLKDYKSKNHACKTGDNVFFVEGNGDIHRCWQDKVKIGNLYTDDLGLLSSISSCEKNICGCFIGYSNLKEMKLDEVYKKSLLGRLP